ncbi:hypothetical protein QBC43DRAFT_75207 [Cladorrhinum sp. PSN259]|nr:hypothetical protein QBC43DRAFT_75207 [Cladorrhinum sp. PSN259]
MRSEFSLPLVPHYSLTALTLPSPFLLFPQLNLSVDFLLAPSARHSSAVENNVKRESFQIMEGIQVKNRTALTLAACIELRVYLIVDFSISIWYIKRWRTDDYGTRHTHTNKTHAMVKAAMGAITVCNFAFYQLIFTNFFEVGNKYP